MCRSYFSFMYVLCIKKKYIEIHKYGSEKKTRRRKNLVGPSITHFFLKTYETAIFVLRHVKTGQNKKYR